MAYNKKMRYCIDMSKQITSRKRAKALSSVVLLLGLAVLAFVGWWPGILLVIGISLALRQYLLGNHYDVVVTLLVFGGSYLTMEASIPWQIFFPTIFILGAIYILVREYFDSNVETVDEEDEDINHEIEEDQKKK